MKGGAQNPYKLARQKAGLTQEAAAERLGFSLRSLQAYESGETDPPFGRVIQMSLVYQCDLYDFVQIHPPERANEYLYEAVRIQGVRTGSTGFYGIAVRKLEGVRNVLFTVIPNVSANEELVRKFTQWCTWNQMKPDDLPDAICRTFPEAESIL